MGYFDKVLARQLQHCQKVDDDAGDPHFRVEHADEFDEAVGTAQFAQDDAHVLAHRQLLTLHAMMAVQLRLPEDGAPCLLQVGHADIREALLHRFLDPDLDPVEIALGLRQCIQLCRGEFHLFVFYETPHQFGTRIVHLRLASHLGPGQKHARLDLDQHRCHDQIVGGELKIA